RWTRTRSGRLVIGSEAGAIAVPFDDVLATGQLDPGEALAVRLADRQLLMPDEVVAQVVEQTAINFGDLSEHRLLALPRGEAKAAPKRPSTAALNLFGWSLSRTRLVAHLAETGKEPITSMGYDRPLPVFSAMRPPL